MAARIRMESTTSNGEKHNEYFYMNENKLGNNGAVTSDTGVAVDTFCRAISQMLETNYVDSYIEVEYSVHALINEE